MTSIDRVNPESDAAELDADRIAWLREVAIPCIEAVAEEAREQGLVVTFDADLPPRHLIGTSRSLRFNINRRKDAPSPGYKALFTVAVTEFGDIKTFGYGERFASLGRLGEVTLGDLRAAFDRAIQAYRLAPPSAAV